MYYSFFPFQIKSQKRIKIMYSKKNKFYIFIFLTFFLLTFSGIGQAQSYSFKYYTRIEVEHAAEPPNIRNVPDLDFPEAAKKNGVEGTLKAKMTLGEDGKTRDIVILEGLPDGVNEAFTRAAEKILFQPARKNGKPAPTTLFMDFIVSVGYNEDDKSVSKPKITDKPAAVYPEKYRAEKLKGKVEVGVMFYKDGTVEVTGVGSVMPKEFDHAAREAASKIKFEPAIHKKSKKKVGQAMTVIYEFKP